MAAHSSEQRNFGLSQNIINYLQSPDWRSVENDLKWLKQDNNHILSIQNSAYPYLLKQTCNAPPLLFVHGNLECLQCPQLAIIGSRNPSTSGKTNAHDFAKHLSDAGLVITSGLAIGIDGAAHQGTLNAGNHTIAVTGTGLDRVYPARHRDLAHDIAQNGALVSEYPPGTPPLRMNFPRRNRIISGLAAGVLVVEAARNSGSLITARFALEQSREVFAIPGSIHNPLAKGCHALIREGAKLVETAEHVLEELTHLITLSPSPTVNLDQAPEQLNLTPEYQRLLAIMDYDPQPIDGLIEQSQIPVATITSMLLTLELQGIVASTSGARYFKLAKAVAPE